MTGYSGNRQAAMSQLPHPALRCVLAATHPSSRCRPCPWQCPPPVPLRTAQKYRKPVRLMAGPHELTAVVELRGAFSDDAVNNTAVGIYEPLEVREGEQRGGGVCSGWVGGHTYEVVCTLSTSTPGSRPP